MLHITKKEKSLEKRIPIAVINFMKYQYRTFVQPQGEINKTKSYLVIFYFHSFGIISLLGLTVYVTFNSRSVMHNALHQATRGVKRNQLLNEK